MNLKKIVTLSVCVLFIASTFGCQSGSSGAGNKQPSNSGKIVHLKNNIHVQKRLSRGGKPVYRASYANYTAPGSGHMIVPVNTAVTIKASGGFRGKEILITTQVDKKEIHFEFNRRNMGISMQDYIDYITSPNAVSLKGLSSKDRKGIANGKAAIGMSKKGVRMALGYPALHRTPSLDEASWVYWKNRFKTLVVEFNGRGFVKNIRE